MNTGRALVRTPAARRADLLLLLRQRRGFFPLRDDPLALTTDLVPIVARHWGRRRLKRPRELDFDFIPEGIEALLRTG